MPLNQRIELGIATALYASKHFHADKIYGDMLKVIEEELFAERRLVSF